jgi:hypothetical protein
MATATRTRKKPAARRLARPAQVSRSQLTRGRSLTAAAQIVHGRRLERSLKPKAQQGLQWQIDAWDFYDKVGEFALGIDMQAWAVSQVRLAAAVEVASQDEPEFVVADVDTDGDGVDEEVSEADRIAAELVADFAGGSIGQQQLMRRVATQLGVAAESYIVGRAGQPDPDTGEIGEDTWEAYSRDEVKWGTGGWRVDDGVDKFALGNDDVMIRVWIPHPRYRQQPRSSTKAILPDLQEIWALTQSINAQVDSRLAGAGLLIFPKSVELVGSGKAADDDEDDEDQFMNEFIDMVVTPIKDRDTAAAVVPFMVKVDDEAVGKIQYLRFESTSNLEEADKREKAITRLARGMDLPPEQILGTSGMNHWGAWLVAEDTIKGPVSNLASIIVHALTLAWYRPALEAAYTAPDVTGITQEDIDGIGNRMLWFDTTPLEQRPDRSTQARDVFDRGGLSIAALVRESGFAEDDMPDPEELLRIALFLLLKTKPELVLPLMDGSGLIAKILSTEPRDPEQAAQEDNTAGDALDGPQDNRQLPAEPSADQAPGAAA